MTTPRFMSKTSATYEQTRRTFLKMIAAIPLVGTLFPFVGKARASGRLRVARLSQLSKPWSSVTFRYPTVIPQKLATEGREDVEEKIPGVVVRLPDDIAAKRGGDEKAKYYVIDLHCTHYRCETIYLTDKTEFHQVSGKPLDRAAAILCPCHMSVFHLENGLKPAKGSRAKKPLVEFHYEIENGEIVVTGFPPGASQFKPGRFGSLGSEYPVRRGEPGF